MVSTGVSFTSHVLPPQDRTQVPCPQSGSIRLLGQMLSGKETVLTKALAQVWTDPHATPAELLDTVLDSESGRTDLHIALLLTWPPGQHPYSTEHSASLAAGQTPGKQEGSLSDAPNGQNGTKFLLASLTMVCGFVL